ncbi:MAG TPA: hypothetical protein VGR51_04950 [Thermoplasmata archaeon]|nr:hypothetical protein [Thermoplasmata archaeon]
MIQSALLYAYVVVRPVGWVSFVRRDPASYWNSQDPRTESWRVFSRSRAPHRSGGSGCGCGGNHGGDSGGGCGCGGNHGGQARGHGGGGCACGHEH